MLRFLAVVLGVLAAAPAHALSITPISIELNAAGKATRAVITVTNITDEPIAVEPAFERITIDENGMVERHATDAGNFLLLPLQSMLQPGTSQTFRLQWVGAPDIPQSESYYITFNQLPVKGISKLVGVTVLTSFSVAVNVRPISAHPDVQLVGTGVDRERANPRPTITVQNPTPAHALLKHADITVYANEQEFVLPRHQFEQVYGNGLIQPWSKRRFVLPINLPVNASTVSASVSYQPPRP